jgi:hypothetical protein
MNLIAHRVFSQIVSDNQFAAIGLILLSCLADVAIMMMPLDCPVLLDPHEDTKHRVGTLADAGERVDRTAYNLNPNAQVGSTELTRIDNDECTAPSRAKATGRSGKNKNAIDSIFDTLQ